MVRPRLLPRILPRFFRRFGRAEKQPPRCYVFGAGGHARVVRDFLTAPGEPRRELVSVVPDSDIASDLSDTEEASDPPGAPPGPPGTAIRLCESAFLDCVRPGEALYLAIGSNVLRARLAERLAERLALSPVYPALIHPSARVSPSARLGRGCQVLAGAVVNAGAVLGDFTIVNTNAVCEHDTQTGFCAFLGPGAVLCGAATLETGCFLGAASVVLPGRRLKAWSVLGAGSVLTRDGLQTGVYRGVPARWHQTGKLAEGRVPPVRPKGET